jgi:transposase
LKIKQHFHAIIAAAKHNLSNARTEAFNSTKKLLIHTAYGFRNTDNMIAMVMLSCSYVQSGLLGR